MVIEDQFRLMVKRHEGLYCPGTTLQKDSGAGLSVSYYPFKKSGLTAEYIWGGFKFADYNTFARVSVGHNTNR